ncbi:mandelate racemase/muconate lactonizing enzyme domain-containing protein [Heterostelium album PN500]|uniref:Mandelate racemase/muconate lactonizing enzyme domain-containing protein n=1 Tax=Heterostelium pallidum (strain ATCC 26659 / Pp 5 / PN500) TaxID=670386 RepID=D3BT07_HETP5|nr:mandelate racemase/muconate lactonizing enzyme domain-containing protein [Heterostelium album PN500]EFA75622.1 mandelate racemase/muconate lactonizing enzyme domain-containing protein [Heterostelium album PN500]|eukprot:XP_020427756.1 mandelate racemase/muconate lactonizing enzyme domain-containing protein [Heterostelium album PN500]
MSTTKQLQFMSKVINLKLDKYPLNLRNPFGTAHSVTTVRNNVLITLEIDGVLGYGECGVPPKKPLCYFADFDDIQSYFNSYVASLDKTVDNYSTKYNPFNKLSSNLFSKLRPSLDQSNNNSVFYYLLEKLDNCESNKFDYSYASRCCLEMAILDCWGKHLNQPIYEMASLECKELKPFYYTVSLCPTKEQVIDSLEFGLKYTSFIKIKLDSDIKRGLEMIEMVMEHTKQIGKTLSKISIDANSSWSPEIAIEFLPHLSTLSQLISMVEQPFPVETIKTLPETEQLKWKSIKDQYHKEGLLIFADESVCTVKDIDQLTVKKTGGIREALLAIEKAKENGLLVWIGSMVGSSLNCNAAAHILASVSDYGGDLDGGLLITDESQLFNGGFSIVNNGDVKISSESGIGVKLKK